MVSSRDKFMEAAKQLFIRNGYKATSTMAIAKLAGSSESQLMKLFTSKLGLLREVAWTSSQEDCQAILDKDEVYQVMQEVKLQSTVKG